MTIVLSKSGKKLLENALDWYLTDSKAGFGGFTWGYSPELDNFDHEVIADVISLGLVFTNPASNVGVIITQKGADYLRTPIKVKTPFDELINARAEIARLTAALAESERARKVADAGWSECIDVCDEKNARIAALEERLSGEIEF